MGILNGIMVFASLSIIYSFVTMVILKKSDKITDKQGFEPILVALAFASGYVAGILTALLMII